MVAKLRYWLVVPCALATLGLTVTVALAAPGNFRRRCLSGSAAAVQYCEVVPSATGGQQPGSGGSGPGSGSLGSSLPPGIVGQLLAAATGGGSSSGSPNGGAGTSSASAAGHSGAGGSGAAGHSPSASQRQQLLSLPGPGPRVPLPASQSAPSVSDWSLFEPLLIVVTALLVAAGALALVRHRREQPERLA